MAPEHDASDARADAGVDVEVDAGAVDGGLASDAPHDAPVPACPTVCKPYPTQACMGSFVMYDCTTDCANAVLDSSACTYVPVDYRVLQAKAPCESDSQCAEAGLGLCDLHTAYAYGFCYPPGTHGEVAVTCCPM